MGVARIPFGPAEENILTQLGLWMLVVAIIHFVGAAFLLGCGCFGMVGGTAMLSGGVATGGDGAGALVGGGALIGVMVVLMLLGVVLIGQGVLLVQARRAFTRVVRTDEADQKYVSEGFRWLKLFFGIEIAIGMLGIVGDAINLIGGVL